MKNSFSLQQISQTGNLDSNLVLRQSELDMMARFMEVKTLNPRVIQKEIAKELGCSSSNLQRYRNGIKMLSPYRNPMNCKERRQDLSKDDSKRPQLTSKESSPIMETVKSNTSKENNLESGTLKENIEVNDKNLYKILHIKNF